MTTINISSSLLQGHVKAPQRYHETALLSDVGVVNADETQVDHSNLMRVRSYQITERPASNLAGACLHRTLPAALIRIMNLD